MRRQGGPCNACLRLRLATTGVNRKPTNHDPVVDCHRLALGLALAIPLHHSTTEAPKQLTVAVFVGPLTRDGFIDIDSGIADSIRDIQAEIRKSKVLTVAIPSVCPYRVVRISVQLIFTSKWLLLATRRSPTRDAPAKFTPNTVPTM